jgi:hypothetical protein
MMPGTTSNMGGVGGTMGSGGMMGQGQVGVDQTGAVTSSPQTGVQTGVPVTGDTPQTAMPQTTAPPTMPGQGQGQGQGQAPAPVKKAAISLGAKPPATPIEEWYGM